MPILLLLAGDGIRARDVTGVQTCALPISSRPQATLGTPSLFVLVPQPVWLARVKLSSIVLADGAAPDPPGLVPVTRSEERRVGKECRPRWAPNPLEKKRLLYVAVTHHALG